MSKFNRAQNYVVQAGQGPIKSEPTPSGLTHEGGDGFKRDVKSELFLMAVGSFFGEDTFYEKASDKDQRYKALVQAATIQDREWTAKFLKWLRQDGNIRTASLVGAVEFYKASQPSDGSNPQAHDGLNRQVVRDVLLRADEPGEMLAYYMANYGKSFGGGLKRGIADAAKRMYNERNLLKWDSNSSAFRFGDVIELAHPKATKMEWQNNLFKHAIDDRHGRGDVSDTALRMLQEREALMSLPIENRRRVLRDEPGRLRDAGMTWESLAGWLQSSMDAEAWQVIIPQMGYMALLRNLRNFDQANISRESKNYVASILRDPEQVAKSRQFPFRFYAAYENVPSLFWGECLDEALSLSLHNVPHFEGRTAVFIDTSGSMQGGSFSKNSSMTPAKAAAIFGIVLASKSRYVDVFGFASETFKHTLTPGMNMIREIERFQLRTNEVGYGTDFQQAIQYGYKGHDRVFMISDMQCIGSQGFHNGYMPESMRWDEMIPANVPVYGYNLGGHKHGAMPTGPNRQEFGGLSDATFRQIPLLEKGKNAQWPWEDAR